ncbi:NAD(P)-dependent oxidoreductase [bacterium]|nr:NAD(P)-dependent oxidoreductase [bacterium]
MKILITGTTGFLGSHLVAALTSPSDPLSRERVIFALNRRPPHRNHAQIHPFTWEHTPRGELILPEALRENPASEVLPDVIIHTAAMSSFPGCEENPEAAHRANVAVTEQLVAFAAAHAVSLIFLSTDLIFDGNRPPPVGGFRVSDRPMPRSVYARTKSLAEAKVQQLGPRGLILRTSLLYGNALSDHGGPLQWVKNAIEQRAPIPAFTDEWRTPLAVEELVAVILCCLERKTLGGSILHCAGTERVSRYDFLQAVLETLGADLELLSPTSRTTVGGPPRPADVSLAADEMSALLGRPPLPIRAALKRSLGGSSENSTDCAPVTS